MLFLAFQDDEPSLAHTNGTDSELAAAPCTSSATLSRPGTAPTATASREAVDTAVPTLAPDPSAAAPPSSAVHTFVGRVVDATGVPLVDTPISVWGEVPSNSPFGSGEEVAWAQGETGANGAFALEVAPTAHHVWQLVVTPEGMPSNDFELGVQTDGPTTDVGTLVLPRGGRIDGTLLDESGAALGIAVQIAFESPSDTGDGRDRFRTAYTETDPDTGRFEMRGVWASTTTVRCESSLVDVEPVTVDVTEGGAHEVHLVHRGPSPARRLDVVARPATLFASPSLGTKVWLDAADGSTIEPDWVGMTRSGSTYRFDGLAIAEYTVHVDDPAYAPYEARGVEPGRVHVAELRPSGRLSILATDAETGAVIAPLRVAVNADLGAFGSHPETVGLEADPARDGRFVTTPLRGNLVDLVVGAEGYGSATVSVAPALARGEVRDVDVVLQRASVLRGRVLSKSGEPRGGLEVHARPMRPDFDAMAPEEGSLARLTWLSRTPSITATTGRDGAFEFGVMPFARAELEVVDGPYVRAERLDVVPSDGPVELRLPGVGAIEGRLLAPTSASLAAVELWIHPLLPEGTLTDPRRSFVPLVTQGGAQRVLQQDGSFSATKLPEGDVELRLVLGSRTLFHGSSSVSRSPGDWFLLGTVTVRDGETARVELDASPYLPARVEVHVTRDGGPASGLIVSATRTDGDGGAWFGDNVWSQLVGEHGSAVFDQLGAGTWRFRVHDASDTFSCALPGEYVLAPSESVELSADVGIAKGVLTILDAEGKRLARRPLFLVDAAGHPREIDPGADGRIELELAVGTYEIALLDEAAMAAEGSPFALGPRSSVEWTVEGPEESEVRVTLPRR
ncbi:MAG: hypothetical protein R3F34_08290 [Planctomycetota bacterium]